MTVAKVLLRLYVLPIMNGPSKMDQLFLGIVFFSTIEKFCIAIAYFG